MIFSSFNFRDEVLSNERVALNNVLTGWSVYYGNLLCISYVRTLRPLGADEKKEEFIVLKWSENFNQIHFASR